jgi:F-type H+-transporting ATPase subunit b
MHLAQEGGGSNFLLPNATFLVELLAFVLLLWAIRKWVLPPLQKAMNDRQEMIRTQIEEARQARERLDEAEREYRDLLDATRADASRIREEARAEGQAIINELRERAQQEADRVRERGEAQLAVEREQVLAELRRELGDLAVQLSERIIGESLQDDTRQQRVVDRFLSELESREPQEAR